MLRILPLIAVAAVAVAGCSHAPDAVDGFAAPTIASGASRMVVTAHPLASSAGLQMLHDGGSAVDAAIAAQMVLTLVEPQSSGIGGGGFMLHYAAAHGGLTAYDGCETAPASAHPEMFLDTSGKPLAFSDAVVGGLSVGVPGLLRMLEMAHAEHGRLPWARLFEPAIRLAEEGFAVSPRLHRMIAADEFLNVIPATSAYFLAPDGSARHIGYRLANKSLARTLRLIAQGGADAFYTGPIAADIVAAVNHALRRPAAMTVADLAGYRAVKREAVCLPYRVWLACGMPPPSSGSIATLQILGLLQERPMEGMATLSIDAVHLLAEASRLAFADRDVYIADPASVAVPTAGLLDPGYLRLRGQAIDPSRSIGLARPGTPGRSAGLRLAPDPVDGRVSTSHVSVIDATGNAVSMTSSIEGPFGSRLMTRGFLLNNQLTDFSFQPSRDAVPHAKRAEPGKRPRSSMAPTLVFDASGKVAMAIGSPGGSRIIGYVAQTLSAVLDGKLGMQAAISLPRVVNRNGPTELESGSAVVGLQSALEARGHEVRVVPIDSGLHGILATVGGLEGGADPRREGVAMGDR